MIVLILHSTAARLLEEGTTVRIHKSERTHAQPKTRVRVTHSAEHEQDHLVASHKWECSNERPLPRSSSAVEIGKPHPHESSNSSTSRMSLRASSSPTVR